MNCSPVQAFSGLSSSSSTARASLSWSRCGRCLRGGIGIEQQGIHSGFECGEPFVLFLQQIQALLAGERVQLVLLRSLLDVVNGLGLPRFRGQVDRSHAMTLRLSIDDQPNQDQAPVHASAEAGGY